MIQRDSNLNPDNVSDRTIRNWLNDAGLRARKLTNTFKLTEKHRLKRFEWADEFRFKTKAFFESIIWSDESKMYPQRCG